MQEPSSSVTLHASALASSLAFDPVPDELAEELAQHARSMVDVASEAFAVTLDWSLASLEGLERILADIAAHMEQEQIDPQSERAQLVAMMSAAYLGEVFRNVFGGGWQSLRTDGDNDGQLCLRTPGDSPVVLVPLSRVLDRLLRGDSFNVWHYAQAAASLAGAGHPTPGSP